MAGLLSALLGPIPQMMKFKILAWYLGTYRIWSQPSFPITCSWLSGTSPGLRLYQSTLASLCTLAHLVPPARKIFPAPILLPDPPFCLQNSDPFLVKRVNCTTLPVRHFACPNFNGFGTIDNRPCLLLHKSLNRQRADPGCLTISCPAQSLGCRRPL